jgi:hypothetical protein
MSVVSVVYCQVEVFATGRSLVQRSPTDCGVSVCVMKRNNPYTPNHSEVERGWTKKEELRTEIRHISWRSSNIDNDISSFTT